MALAVFWPQKLEQMHLGKNANHPTLVWIVTHGRLKRCSPEQLRHASEREKLLAEGADNPSTSWTFHSLSSTLYKGDMKSLMTWSSLKTK